MVRRIISKEEEAAKALEEHKDKTMKDIVVEHMAKKINEMEDNHQIIRPVAMALRKELGIDAEHPKEKFELNVVNPIPAKKIEAGKKATKKDLIAALRNANAWIEDLQEETNDVRRVAEHYMGFSATEHYSAGALYVLDVKLRNQELEAARKSVGEFFSLNETAIDNLSNNPGTIVANVLNKYKEFWKDINEARNILGYVIKNIDGSGLDCVDATMLKIGMKLLESTLNRHFATGINPVD